MTTVCVTFHNLKLLLILDTVVETSRNVMSVGKCMILIAKRSMRNNFIKKLSVSFVRPNSKFKIYRAINQVAQRKLNFVSIVNSMYPLMSIMLTCADVKQEQSLVISAISQL